MKLLVLTALLVIFWSASAGPVNTRKQCEWGASYWCQTYDTALTCGQIEYCQTHVWKNEMKKDDFEKAVLYHGAPLNSGKNLETAPNDDYCSICKIVVKYLQGFVGSKKTEDEVEKEVKLVCNYLGPVATECREFIDHYFDDAWKLLLEELTPDQVCAELRLCNSTKLVKPVQPVFVTETKTSAECEMCDLLAKYVVKEVKEPGSKAKVKSDLEDTCKLFKPVATECLAFVNTYFDELWNEVVKDASSPKTLCSHLIPSCPPSSFERSKRADDNKLTCFACKEGVKLLGKILNGQTMKDKVNGIVDSLCKRYLPQQDQTECQSFAEPIVDKLYSDIIQQVTSDPSKTCYEVGECSKPSYSSNKLLLSTPSLKSVQVKQSDCDICELVVTYLDKIIDQNSTEEEAEQLVEKLCSYLGSYKSQCDQLVNQYFDTIWKLLEQNLDPKTVCTELGLCTSSSLSSKSKLTHPKVKKSVKLKQSTCDICKFVVTFLDNFLEENTTENEAKDLVEKLCTILGSFEQECKSLIDDNFDMIWQLLLNELKPDTVCDLLRLCNSTTLTTKDKLLLYKIRHFKKSQSPQLKQTDCDICKLVVGYIDTFLKENSTETEAKDLVEKVCTFLGSDAQQCKSLIDNNFDMIWKMLVNEATPDAVCDILGLCSSTTLTTKDKLLLYKTQHFKKSQGTITCILCGLVMKELDKLIDTNSTEADIEKALEKVCSLLPSSISSDCDDFVKEYGPEIIKALINAVSSDAVCHMIGICTAEEVTVSSSGTDCNVCVDVLKGLKVALPMDTKLVTEVLEKLCSLIPSAISDECKDLVDAYGPELVKIIANDIDPQKLCQDVHLCTGQTLKKTKKGYAVVVSSPKTETTCDKCHEVLEQLEIIIPKNEKYFINFLSSLCKIPILGAYGQLCQGFIEQYGHQIIHNIVFYMSPRAICQDFKLCTASRTWLPLDVSKKHY